MAKSPDAFRTISEVADWLGIQAHVLRFWESKFSQVKPVKRAGGRRYYRPNDMLLLGGIRKLLHEDGLTIKGVQKILREEGISHVIALSPPLDDQADVEEHAETPFIEAVSDEAEEKGVVLSFESGAAKSDDAAAVSAEEAGEEESVTAAKVEEPKPEVQAEPETAEVAAAPAPVEVEAAPDTVEEAPDADEAAPQEDAAPAAKLPAFLRRPMADAPSDTDNPPPTPEAAPVEEEPPAPAAPKPRNIEMPEITPIADIPVSPGALTIAAKTRRLTKAQAEDLAPLLKKLAELRDKMASRRQPGAHPGPVD